MTTPSRIAEANRLLQQNQLTMPVMATIASHITAAIEDLITDDDTAPQHWYVSGVNGNDLNDGRTPQTALATLTRLEALLPNEITALTIAHIGPAGLGSERYATPSFRPRKLSKSLILVGDGGGQTGAAGAAYTVLTSATTVAGTTTTSLAATVSWVANAYVGKTVYITDASTGAGQPRLILSNTTSTLTPSYPITGAATGSSFDILEANVILDVPDNANAGEHVLIRGCGIPSAETSTIVGNSPAVYIMNMRFMGTPTGTYSLAIQGSRVVFAGVEYRGSVTMQIRTDNSTLLCGIDAADATTTIALACGGAALSLNGISLTSAIGWGFSSLSAISGSANHSFGSGRVDGFIVSTRGIVFREDCTFYLRGGSYTMPASNTRAPITIRNGARGFIIAQTAALPIIVEGPSTSGIDVGGVVVLDNAKVGISGISISVAGAGISGIWVARGGMAEIASSPVVGTGGIGGYGLCVGWGGIASIPTSVGWVLTGTLGDMSVDNHSGFPASLLSSSGKMARGPGLIERLN